MKLPVLFVPIAVVLFALLAFPLKKVFTYPAATVSLSDATAVAESDLREIEMTVQGVKCQGTANYFLGRYSNQPGIVSMEAFAADHKVMMNYDASKVSLDQIRAIGEAPVVGNDGHEIEFFKIEEVRER